MWLAVALLRFTTHFRPIQMRFIAAKSGSSVVETTDLRQGTCSLKFVHQPPLGVHQAQTRYAEASERTSQFKDFQRALAGVPGVLIHCQHADAATGLASLCQAYCGRSPFMFASPFLSGIPGAGSLSGSPVPTSLNTRSQTLPAPPPLHCSDSRIARPHGGQLLGAVRPHLSAFALALS